jgi:hypothetical protein
MLNSLPDDLLLKVLSYFEKPQIARIASVCQNCNKQVQVKLYQPLINPLNNLVNQIDNRNLFTIFNYANMSARDIFRLFFSELNKRIDSNSLNAINFKEQNKDLLLKVYKQCSEIGNSEAQFQLAQFIKDNSIYIKKDSDTIIYWLEKAAKQEEARAQFNLGMLRLEGVYNSIKEKPMQYAYDMLQRAADNQYSPAHRALVGLNKLKEF